MDVDSDRLGERIERLGRIGATESGGVTRLGLSSLEKEAMEVTRGWLEELGCETRYDAAGNLWGRWDPTGTGVAPAVTGSHLDSVVEGGCFDGPAGVVCAVEAVAALDAAGYRPQRPIDVVAITSEEGSRFGAGLLGSTAIVRGLSEEQLALTDPDGTTVADAMRDVGGDPDAVREPTLEAGDLHAFVEVHIEQARTLERRGAPVGVVTGIAAPVFRRLTLTGVTDHAGATPMDQRRDAFLGAAEFALAAERIAAGTGSTVATVGQVAVVPGNMNAIPGRCVVSLDLRDTDEDVRDRVERELLAELDAIASRRALEVEAVTLQREAPVDADARIASALVAAAEEAGVEEVVTLPSGAAHDAMVLAEVTSIGMLFVRSRDGLSHTPDEFTSTSDLVVAATVLAGTLRRLTAPPTGRPVD